MIVELAVLICGIIAFTCIVLEISDKINRDHDRDREKWKESEKDDY